MTRIGFSTGALALGNFEKALALLRGKNTSAIELSALRTPELPKLIAALPSLELKEFSYVAVHAPSFFTPEQEGTVVRQLMEVPKEYPIILHPDAVHDFAKWSDLQAQLLLENMDRRKADGRSARELQGWFNRFPEARLCLDLAHAQHVDPTMTEASQIISTLGSRICQVHISELDSNSHHHPMSYSALRAFAEVAYSIVKDAAFIIESNLVESPDPSVQIDDELEKVRNLLSRTEWDCAPAWTDQSPACVH